MKKLFTLLTLTLLSIGTAWATDVTVKRSIAYVAAGGTTDAVHQFTGYNDGANDIITVTADETAGSLTGTTSKTRNVTYNNKETQYSAAKVYRNKNASGNDVNNDTYDDNCYVGIKLVIADGYRIDVSQLKAQVGVGDDNFKYKLVVTDGTHDLYTSQDKTAKKANENISTINITSPNKLVVCGTVYLRMYFTITNGGTSKYIQPFELSLKGDVATAPQYTISTVASPDGTGTITGAGSYYENQDVFLNATPNSGYGFVNWTVGGSEVSTSASYSFKAGAADATYTANFETATFYTITGEITDAQSTYGSITNEGDNVVSENGNITFEATPNEGYVFVKWQKNGADFDGNTAASIEVTATADATYTAIFKKLFTVTYDIDDYNNTTTKALNNYDANKGINEKYAAANDKYTIPAYSHYYMYREGYRFIKWEDQDGNQYEKGTEYTLTKDITLTPVWVATTQTLANSAEETTVTWKFEKNTILFNGWQYAPQVGYYTKPLTVNGELIAVPMIVNATSGKVDNSSRTDALAQVNGGTTFTIPAIKGMTVVLYANNNISNTTVAGNTPSSGSGTKTATYNYTGENGTAVIAISDGSYYEKIVVTYPAITSKTITPAYNRTTYVTTMALDFSNVDGLKAYKATAASAGKVTLTEVGAVPAGTPLVLIGTADEEYTVPVAASASAPETNLLQAGDGTTEFYGTSYDYILYTDGKFYQIGSGSVAVGKAYLHCKADPNPNAQTSRSLKLVFGNETTGIGDATRLKDKGQMKNDVFNLNGQRVKKAAKGLYIKNGKKYVK